MKLDSLKVKSLLLVSKCLIKTLKIDTLFYSKPQFPSIVAFWHGRMFLLPFALKEFAPEVSILISRHRDGELVAKLVEKLGFRTIRGSTGKGKGGGSAFLKMVEAIKHGKVVAITPDGPKGPREKVKPGIAKLAKLTGVPIYPLTFKCSSELYLKSWDRFAIPKPFAKCKVILGKPIYPQEFENEENLAREVERKLLELNREAQ